MPIGLAVPADCKTNRATPTSSAQAIVGREADEGEEEPKFAFRTSDAVELLGLGSRRCRATHVHLGDGAAGTHGDPTVSPAWRNDSVRKAEALHEERGILLDARPTADRNGPAG